MKGIAALQVKFFKFLLITDKCGRGASKQKQAEAHQVAIQCSHLCMTSGCRIDVTIIRHCTLEYACKGYCMDSPQSLLEHIT